MSETYPPEIATADELARLRDAEYQQTYADWFAAMSPEEQAQMTEMGLDLPVMDGLSRRAAKDDGDNDRPELGEMSTLIDGLEPLTQEPGQPVMLVDGLGSAMSWVTEPEGLVQVGIRTCVMVHVMRPALMPVGQLHGDPALVEEFAALAADNDADAANIYGPFLEWIRRGATLSQIGQRFMVAVYVSCPALIESPTLEALGELNSKTRQA